MYKTVLCKYCLTASKIRVMGIRAMGNCVRRGMTVVNSIEDIQALCNHEI